MNEYDQIVKGLNKVDSGNEYDSVVKSIDAEAKTLFNASTYNSDPKQKRLSYGVDKTLEKRYNFQEIKSKAPSLSPVLANPDLAPIVADDIENLSYWERWKADISQRPEIVESQFKGGELGFKKMLGGELTPSEQLELNKVKSFTPKDYDIGFFAGIPGATIEGGYQMMNTIGEALPYMGGAAIAGGLGGGLLGAVATRTPAGAIAGAEIGATSFGKGGYEVGKFNSVFKLEGGNALLEFEDMEDSQGNKVDADIARGASALYGATSAALELVNIKVFEKQLPFADKISKYIGKDKFKEIIKAGTKGEALKRIGGAIKKGAISEGTTESLQEFSQIIIGETQKVISSGEGFGITKDTKEEEIFDKLVDWFAEASERVAEAGVQGVQAGMGMSATLQTTSEGFKAIEANRKYKKQQKDIEKAIGQTKESKTFQESPKAWIDITKENLGKDEIYIPAEKVKEFFQGKEELYNAMAEIVPEMREQFSEAMETNGDLVLPANKVIAGLASNNELESLKQFMRYTPDALYDAQFDEDMLNRVYDMPVEEKPTDEVQNVINNLEKQLYDAGYTPYQTSQYVSLTKKALSNELKKAVDPEVKKFILNKYKNLQIQKQRKVEEFDSLIEKARKTLKAKKSTPLIDYLKRRGGVREGSNLAGELLNAGLDKRLIKGLIKKDGKLGDVDNIIAQEFVDEFGLEATQIEQDYIDRGYVDRQYLLNLLKDEIEGKPLKSAELQLQEQEINDFIEELDRAGVSLKDSNERIKAALEKRSAEGMGEVIFDQAPPIESDAFKKWFGDSKVVDENGKPLVVYHGTDKDFEKFDIGLSSSSSSTGVSDAVFFSKSADVAGTYGGYKNRNITPVFLSIKNPLIVDAEGRFWNEVVKDKTGEWKTTNSLALEAKALGYDGLIITNVIDAAELFTQGKGYLLPDREKLVLKLERVNNIYEKKVEEELLKIEKSKLSKTNKIKKKNNLQIEKFEWNEYKKIIELQKLLEVDRKSTSYAVFNPTQIKSVFNRGTFDPNDPRILFQSAPTFYSALEKSIVELQLNKGSKEQWQGIIKNLTQKGVKQEEIDWLGINDWLAEQEGQDTKRGSIRFGQDATIINVFEGSKDLSTLLHELGHFFLETRKEMIERFGDRVDENIIKDYNSVFGWFEKNYKDIYKDALKIDRQAIEEAGGEEYVKERISLRAINIDGFDKANDAVAVAMHEYFARGFEAYLMKGEAPSVDLRDAFRNFKAWLLGIYKNITGLGVNLNQDITDIFDRMLASENEISAMKDRVLFKPDEEIMKLLTSAERQAYIKRQNNQIKTAEEKLLRKLLRDKAKKEKAWYKAEKQKVMAETEKMFQESPLYKLIKYLKDGTDFAGGEYALKHTKLSRQDIKARFPDLYNSIPAYAFGKADNIMPEMLSELFGYTNPREMLVALSEAKPMDKAVAEVAEQTMLERYGDALKDGTIERAALEALQNDDRASKIEYELQVINRKANLEKVAFKEQSRAMAIDILHKKKLKDGLNLNLYYIAEVNSAKESGKALGQKDYKKASEYKAKQLLNHYLYREGLILEKQKKQAEKLFLKVFTPDKNLGKTRNIELVIAARALLSKFGFSRAKGDPVAELQKIKERNPYLYEELEMAISVASAQAKPFKDMTFEEFKGLRDAVLNLWEVARRDKQIEIEGQRMKKALVVEEINEGLNKLLSNKKKLDKYVASTTEKDRSILDFMSWVAAGRRFESWLSQIENNEGAITKYIFNPLMKATLDYRKEKKDYYERLKAIYAKIPNLGKQEIYADELVNAEGKAFKFSSKQHLIHAILHTGNNSNKRKLLLGYGWASTRFDGSLDTTKWDKFLARMWDEGVITKQDYDAIQEIWDLLEELKPQAWKAHKQLYGYYPSDITAEAVQTPFGMYKGGYVPAIYDPLKVPDAGIKQDVERLLEGDSALSMLPSVSKGFTKSRAENYARELELNLNRLTGHIDKVLRFSHIQPVISSSIKIITDASFKETMFKVDKRVYQEVLLPFMRRVANQTIETPMDSSFKFLGKFANFLRKRSGMAIMFLNIVNALQQITGLSVAALKVKPKYLGRAFYHLHRNPSQVTKDIKAKSLFMNQRTDTTMFDAISGINDLIVNPTKYDKVKEFSQKNSYFLQTMMQHYVDLMVWQGAYVQAIEEGKNDVQAVRKADSAVRQTQGSFNPEDLSKAESGTAVWRLFTQFYSYFNMVANANYSEGAKAIRELGWKGASARLFYIYVFGLMIPSVVAEAIVQGARGEDFDEDDDGYIDDIIELFSVSQLRSLTASVPVLGQVGNFAINAANELPYDNRISTAPGVSMIESSVRGVGALTAPSEINSSDVKDIGNLITILSGVPITPITKAISYDMAVRDRKVRLDSSADYLRGILTGKR